jgi:sucrose phosphorylase
MAEALTDIEPAVLEAMRVRLSAIYGDEGDACLSRIGHLLRMYAPRLPRGKAAGWSERDVVLITYGDQIRSEGRSGLETLRLFLKSQRLDELIRTVHLLPIHPYSSDDGFSVIDFRAVNPSLGTWDDIRRLGEQSDLMFDLVLNHVSVQSKWFQGYLAGEEPYRDFFIEANPDEDLSTVTRPRSLPLLTPFETSRGTRHLWTTFSADQVDLNFANPDVLVEMIDVLLFFIEQGARIIRLDAVAFLWKEVGTTCLHLWQTHEIVKLLRDVVNAVAPHVLLLTETNVPHEENVSYLGDNDEAHMVYQFSLPPLLLDAVLSGDAAPLLSWLSSLEPAPAGAAYFNFTASHDGVGVRPLEGLVDAARMQQLVAGVKAHSGLVSTRRQPDGTDSPYELNISYVSAMGAEDDNPALHARRFLTSQGLMLALRGVPAVYVHSLLGTENDLAGVEESGQPRRINRRKFQLDELESQLSDTGSLQTHILEGYRRLLAVRTTQPAFHPDADQEMWPLESDNAVAVVRTSTDGRQKILVLANFSAEMLVVDIAPLTGTGSVREIIADASIDPDRPFTLEPWGLAWIETNE